MSVSHRARRRVSLLASSSLVAASLLAGVAGLSSLAVAPGVALAADECGDPSANAGGNDVLVCSGAYANIDYTTTTNGNLTLNLEDGVVVTNGIAVTGNAGEILTVRATTNVVGSGDPTVVNPAGYAINVQGQGATVNIDLRSSDIGVDGLPGPDIGTTRGINATNSVGTVQVRMNEGEVNASAGFGINAVGVGGVVINLTNGTTVTASGAAVRGVSSSGTVDIFTSGLITSDNTGIFASGADGAFVETGAVTGGAAGVGIQAQSSGGPAVVTTHGAVSGGVGIVADSGGGGASVVVLGGTVTGTVGNGITQAGGNTGSMLLNSNGNAITGATNGVVMSTASSSSVEAILGNVTANGGNGVDVTAGSASALVVVSSTGTITATGIGVNIDTGGDATVSVTNVTAGTGYGVIVDAGGSATINVSGVVTGAGGVAAQSGGADDATVNLLAGSTTSGTDGFSYGAFAQATGTGDAIVNVDGDVADGGVGAFAGSGSATVSGAGNISMLGGFDAVEVATTSGAIVVDLGGNVSGGGDGVDASSTSGAISIVLGGTVSGADDGVEATSGTGAIGVVIDGSVSGGTGDGVFASTDGGAIVVVNSGGSATGLNGINVETGGADNATVAVNAGGSAGSTGGGYGVQTSTFGSGNAVATIGGTITDGGVGAFAFGSGSTVVSVANGATINDTSGFPAIETFAFDGSVIVDNNGTVNSAGDGIDAQTFGAGTVGVVNTGTINAAGAGISASTSGGAAVTVINTGVIAGSATSGILAGVTAGGDVTVVNQGFIGSAGDPTSSHGILATVDGGAGDIVVTSIGDIYTDGVGPFGAGIGAVHFGTAGSVTVSHQGVINSGGVGIGATILDPTNADDVTLIVGDGSTITAGSIGVLANNDGLGEATTIIGAGVTIDPDDYGSYTASAANDATAIVGDNAVVVVTNTDGDNTAIGVYAESGQAADDAVGDESVEITVGVNASVTVDDGAAGDADGAGGIIGFAYGAAGGVGITVGDGLNLAITGNNAVGVGGTSLGGDITLVTGTGTIDILGLDNTDLTGNFPGTAGIGAISASGDVVISSATTISVNNGTLDAAGIYGETGGTGFVSITSNGQILSSDNGIEGEAVDGLVQLVSNAAIGATENGIVGRSTGLGDIIIVNTNNVTAANGVGIGAINTGAGGAVFVTSTGPTINAGAFGIAAINSNAASAGLVQVQNSSDINANLLGLGVSAIFAGDAGTGGVLVNNVGGSIAGTADVGILAVSGGTAGNVVVNTSGAGSIGTAVNSIDTVGISASITDAASTGSIAVTAGNTGGIVSAGTGILASNSGTGTVAVQASNGVSITGADGIRTSSAGGAATVTVGTGGALAATTSVIGGTGAANYAIDFANVAGGTNTLNIATNGVVRSSDLTTAGYGDNAVRVVGGTAAINNAGRIHGLVDLSGVTGSAAFSNTGIWHTTGTSTFGGGVSTLTNSATGSIFTNAGGAATTFDFGAGADTFTNAGLLVVGEPALAASTLTITGLETWNNSGRIVFGSSGTTMAALSDGQINDRILASGTTFTGSGSSRLVMDVNLGATPQTSCAVLAAADCLSLTGGSTAGSTQILVNDVSGNAFGAFNPTGIVVVDVAGAGSTAATHFSLDPATANWRADLNSADGVIDKGLFFYDLTLNGAKQHVLVGLPDSEAFEFTTFGAALSSIWQTTTGVWFERQADLRDQLDSGDGGAGVWMKIAGSTADRDRVQGYELFGVDYSFDTSYSQDTVALIGGVDFIGGGAGKSWVIGGQIGYVDSDVTYDNSPTLTSFEGMTLGVYGSYVAGPLFVDGIVNANMLDYDHQAITLAPAGSNIFSGSVDTLGFQVEGGWTMALGANGFFEPLAVLSYSSSDVEGLSVPGSDVEFDDFTSLRASLGGRIGVNADHGTFSTKWALVARYWNEFEGDNEVSFSSAPGFKLNDDFSGSFGEIGGTVNVFGADDRFSAFLNIGTKFQDDYQSVDGSLGLRWRW